MMRGRFCLRALLVLAAAAVASVAAADAADTMVPPGASPVDSGLFVVDGVLDTEGPSSREALLERFTDTMGFTGEKRYGAMSVPTALWRRMLGLFGVPGDNEAKETTKVPVKVASGQYTMHRDMGMDQRFVDGRVSVLYLEGDGHMTFAHVATHKKHTIDVKPGRLISWDNRDFYHSLDPAPLTYPRRMIGPMSFARGEFQTAGYFEAQECLGLAGYLCSATPLATPADNFEANQNPPYRCADLCYGVNPAYAISQYNPTGNGGQGTCYCFDATNPCPGNAWAQTAGWVTWTSGIGTDLATCPTLPPAAPSTPFSLQASLARGFMASGGCSTVNIRMTRQPAGSPGARALLASKNHTTQYPAVATKTKPGNSTTYSLRVTLPAGWTFKRAGARPSYKPTSAWKNPQMTTGQASTVVLLWTNVPLPQYGAGGGKGAGGKVFTRSFKISCCSPKQGTAPGSYPILVEVFQVDQQGNEFNNKQAALTASVKPK